MQNGVHFGMDLDTVDDDPVGGFNQLSLSQDAENMTILGSGSRDSVEFEWMVTEWSECSQKCGPEFGYKVNSNERNANGKIIASITSECVCMLIGVKIYLQFRRTKCMVRLHNTTQHVDSVLCKDAGLSEPETFEKCGGEECPRWVTGEWTLCLQSRCQRRNKAIQDRSVQCLFPNNTSSDSCDSAERPITRQECDNERCKPYWRMDKWTDVGHSTFQCFPFVFLLNNFISID